MTSDSRSSGCYEARGRWQQAQRKLRQRGGRLAGFLVFATLALGGLCEPAAHATNVLEFPDNGSEQMARGGAWVARASDPLATYFNPAGLAGQDTRLTGQSNLTFRHACMTRLKATNDTTPSDGVGPGGYYPQVCAKDTPFPNPQLAFAYRLSERVGLGIAFLGPSAAGSATWPEFIGTGANALAAPQRYLLLKTDALLVYPTIGIGAEIATGLRVGVSFAWGFSTIKLANAATALNQALSPRDGDIKADITAKDLFIPVVNVSTIYSPSPNVDIAGWFHASGAIDASADVKTSVNYFDPRVAAGDSSAVRIGDSRLADCGDPKGNSKCPGPNAGHITVNQPMEAKLGVRFHTASGLARAGHRDPMRDDRFDAEIDLTWANNSALDAIKVRFPANADGSGVIPAVGTGGTVPPIADVPRGYKDVFGVRVGGDYNVIPDKLTLRAGAFLETNGQDPALQNVDFMGARRLGVSGGLSYRIHLGGAGGDEPTRNLTLMAGFGHIFVADQARTDPNATGLSGLAGSPCYPSNNDPGPTCPNGNQKFRTNWPVNLGTITNSVNVINVGASYRF